MLFKAEKAGGSGSIPSLATTITHSYTPLLIPIAGLTLQPAA
jgi:hypothetical protein